MLVYEYVNLLVAGELKPLALSNIGGDNRDEVQEKNFQDIVGMLNLAYSVIYEKFALYQKEILLENIENNKPYNLPLDFVYPIKAELKDGTKVPFNDDRKVLDGKIDIGLSIMFPEPFFCLVKGVDENNNDTISLIYSAAPDPVTGPHDTIRLTGVFTQAVLDYVAYRAYIGIDGHIEQTNNTYYMRFIADCREIQNSGLAAIDNLDSNMKLVDRGYP